MDTFSLKSFQTILIILASIVLGLILPQVGVLWQSYSPLLLGFLMFLVSLTIKPLTILRYAKDYRSLGFALIMIFVAPPLLATPALFFFSPIEYAAIVLAVSAPAAASSVFWCTVFCGQTALAIVISIISNVLAIITIPVTFNLLVGFAVQVDTLAIILNLLYIVLIPIVLAQIVQKLLPKISRTIVKRSGSIQHVTFFLLIWGSVAPAAGIIRVQALNFVFLSIFLFYVLGTTFLIAFLIGKRLGTPNAIAIGITSGIKNSTLAIVIGSLLLGPMALPALVAHLVVQNLFLVPVKTICDYSMKNSRSCNPTNE